MRFIRFLIAFGCLSVGAIVGALNVQMVDIDFGVRMISAPLGIVLILALLVGVAVGGLAVTASLVLPLRRRLARAERQRPAPALGTDA